MATGDPVLDAMWEQAAIEVGNRVYQSVNLPGTDETGYILMFFSAKEREGKSTFVSSETDVVHLRKLLKFALRNLEKAKIVPPPGVQ